MKITLNPVAPVIVAAALIAGGCVNMKTQALSNEFVQGLLSTLPHSFTGSKHIDHVNMLNVGVSVDFKGLKYDETAKQWTWTAASYAGHSPWTATNISDTPDLK